MQKVAKEYGISDGTLGNTCRKLYIPTPGVGYWVKKAANHPVEPHPPLPVIQTRSQLPEGRPQHAIAGITPAGLPQTARPESQRNDDPGCNQPTPANRAGPSQARKPSRRLPEPASLWTRRPGDSSLPNSGGDHPDASPLGVGDDFYLTHLSLDDALRLISLALAPSPPLSRRRMGTLCSSPVTPLELSAPCKCRLRLPAYE